MINKPEFEAGAVISCAILSSEKKEIKEPESNRQLEKQSD